LAASKQEVDETLEIQQLVPARLMTKSFNESSAGDREVSNVARRGSRVV